MTNGAPPRYIDVALNIPVNQPFTYRVPEPEPPRRRGPAAVPAGGASGTEGAAPPSPFGRRVEVRFGNRRMTGIVVGAYAGIPAHCAVDEGSIRSAARYVDAEPVLTEECYGIARWMSRYYLASIGEAAAAMVPSGRREADTPGLSFSEDEESFACRELSGEQRQAVDGILGGGTRFHYLYGVTGSGKTEVFLSAAERVLAAGRGVIYLVPEIGLTPQVVEAVVRRFGPTAAVLHSGLTPSQRLGEWRRVLHREARIVVGARSAVFAPVPDLGLVIIDEEHDGSYKSGSSPRYHARQVAMYRCSRLGIPLVMGSATPSVEAWKSMQEGAITRHALTCRLAGGAPPAITAVNLSLRPGSGCLSRELIREMRSTLDAGRQAILFLNRRGFTHFFRCNGCGFELKCRNCSVALTYHKAENRLRCHYCGYTVQPPAQCPGCGSLDVGYSGFGTEYIEAEVRAKFPRARVVRADTDSLTRRGELAETLAAFRRGDYDVLLGTQMVAKGLNFPRLRLVGVVLADTALHLPDFRASERTFALITQVAGRAGRFFPDGTVIVQSFSPDREPIALAVRGDAEEFYRGELAQRELLGFPPYARLLRLVFRSAVPGAAQAAARGAAGILRGLRQPGVDILGPADCPLELVGGNWRQQLILRGAAVAPMQQMAAALVRGYAAPQNVHIEVDVDPVNML